jgi:ABC-type transporter Mla subunit MlaD
MKTPSNHWKLGLFVVLGLALALGTALFVGAQSMRRDTVAYTFYFDESVQGLEVGSPTKFRGVIIGNVSAVTIAPDRRRVEIKSAMDTEELKRLGLVEKASLTKVRLLTPPDLRVQLAAQGLTGAKFLAMDFFDPRSFPAPALPFPTPENYVPTAVSTFKNLEDRLVAVAEQMPAMMTQLSGTITRVDGMLARIDTEGLSNEALSTLKSTNQAVTSLQKNLDQMHMDRLSSKAEKVLTNLDQTTARLNLLAGQLTDEKGLVVSANRTSVAIGDFARSANGMTADLGTTLQSLRDAADSFQRIMDALDRQPDMLVKGRDGARKSR